jgi:hypothetical protein
VERSTPNRMSVFLTDDDIRKVSSAATQVFKAAIQNVADVLVPALEQAAKNIVGGIVVTVGPIHVEPITITLKNDPTPQ